MSAHRPDSRRARFVAALLSAGLLAGVLSIGASAIPSPAAADTCAAGQICVLVIDGTSYTVIGPCDTSTLGSSISGCLIISSVGGGGGLIICGLYACGPETISQHALGPTPLEQEGRAEIAELRGIPNDTQNLYSSRGEIRAYMYLRLLALANTAPASRSTEDQATVDEFTREINTERITTAKAAKDLYDVWAQDPCSFQVPVGDPNASHDEPEVGSGLPAPCTPPPNTPACPLGSCVPAPPS